MAEKNENHKLNILIVLILLFCLTGVVVYAVFFGGNNNVLGVSTSIDEENNSQSDYGVAFEWKNDQILNNFEPVDVMEEGWDKAYLSTKIDGNENYDFFVWVPSCDFLPGSRELTVGMKGDDVTALQSALNIVKSKDNESNLSYSALDKNGVYDEKTKSAVESAQEFFGLEKDGIANLDFQANLYSQITTGQE